MPGALLRLAVVSALNPDQPDTTGPSPRRFDPTHNPASHSRPTRLGRLARRSQDPKRRVDTDTGHIATI